MTAEDAGENVATPLDYEEEEVIDFTSGMGEWDGQTYCMKYFPCEPQDNIEGNFTWSQSMCKIYIDYWLTDENAELTASQINFEVCTTSVKVRVGKSKEAKDLFSGTFNGPVRAGMTWWDIVDGEDGRKLTIIFYKSNHEAWKRLFVYCLFNRDTSFSWNNLLGAPDKLRIERPEDAKLREIKADRPLYDMDVPSDVSWQALCIGLDDVQDFEEYIVVNIFLDPKELFAVNQSVPNEEFFRADITEKEVFVYFRIYEYGKPIVAFHGVLEQACVPQLTTWEYIPQVQQPRLNGYAPCLQLVLTKPKESQGLWPCVFAKAKHASEFHAPTPFAAGTTQMEQSAQPECAPGVVVNKDAVVNTFHKLLSTGLSAREATSQAIAQVRKRAEAGEQWALDNTAGTTWLWAK